MWYSAYLPILKRRIKKINSSHGFTPIDWCSLEEKLLISKSQTRRISFRISLILTSLYSFSMLLRMLTISYTILETMQAFLFIIFAFMALPVRWNWNLDSKYVNVINTVVNLEKTLILNERKQSKYNVTYYIMLFLLLKLRHLSLLL